MNLKPLFNQILVQPAEQKQVVLSETPSFLMYGKVLAIGDDCSKVKVGDTISFTLWGLNHIEIEGVRHYFVPEEKEFLLAVLQDEPILET